MNEFNATDFFTLPRIGSIATQPSRLESLETAIRSLIGQLDEIHIYLDHFKNPPHFIENNPKIFIHRAEDLGNYHASSRFHLLNQIDKTSILFFFDDDIIYPKNYVEHLINAIALFHGRVIVGVHGRIFVSPHASYARDAVRFHFTSELEKGCHVHELGTGTCAFLSNLLNFDLSSWPRNDMDDLNLSIEAQKQSIPRVVVKRPRNWLVDNSQHQTNNLWAQTVADDSFQTKQMHYLLSLYEITR